jgi:hypothetical protein
MENTFLDLTRSAGPSALALAVLVATSGCASGILSANLHQYNNGTDLANVGQNIPGAPNGDFVTNIISPVVVTSGGTNLMNGNKLRVNGRVSYRTIQHEVPRQYQVGWRGLRDNHSTTPTLIRLQDSSGRNAVVLRFEGNQLFVRTEDERQNPPAVFAMDHTHEVSIIINLQGARKTLVGVITEEGARQPLFSSPPLDVLDDDFTSLHAVQFESASGASYFMQGLRALAGIN